jgi:hypothetical protein
VITGPLGRLYSFAIDLGATTAMLARYGARRLGAALRGDRG